jgi:hypothetical protein
MDHDCDSFTTNSTAIFGLSLNETEQIKYCGLDYMRLTYMSWMAYDNMMVDMRPPWEVTDETMQPLHRTTGHSRSLMVATRILKSVTARGSDIFDKIYGPWNVLKCSLHHAVYDVNVSSSVSNVSKVVGFDVNILDAVTGSTADDRASSLGDYTPDIPPSTLPEATTNGYMAVLGGLFSVLGGYVRDRGGSKPDIQTGFRTSALIYTRELLQNTAVNLTWTGMEWWTLTDKERASNSIYPEEAFVAKTFNRSLGTAIELLFHKTTLSLLSRPLFLKDTGESSNATIQTWPNVYIYRRNNLLISYGVALSLTMLVCEIGLATIYRNRASYSNAFSTVLRISRGRLEGSDSLLIDRDQSGADPLSRHLAKAQVSLGHVESEHLGEDIRALHIGVRRKLSSEIEGRSVITGERTEESSRRTNGNVDSMQYTRLEVDDT